MTYLQHLINWTRLKAATWVFLAGTIANVLYSLQTTNVLSITWTELKLAVITAVISQITKALSNYMIDTDPTKQINL